MTRTTRYAVRVEWGDCDPAGLVFYPNYFRFADCATHHLLETAGMGIPDLVARYGIVGLPLVDAHLEFRSPSRWGDRLEVESRIAEWRRKTFVVSHTIWNGAAAAVQGHEIRVWAISRPDDPKRLGAGEIPAEVVQRYEAADGH